VSVDLLNSMKPKKRIKTKQTKIQGAANHEKGREVMKMKVGVRSEFGRSSVGVRIGSNEVGVTFQCFSTISTKLRTNHEKCITDFNYNLVINSYKTKL